MLAKRSGGVGCTPAMTRRGLLQWRPSAAAALQESLTLGRVDNEFRAPCVAVRAVCNVHASPQVAQSEWQPMPLLFRAAAVADLSGGSSGGRSAHARCSRLYMTADGVRSVRVLMMRHPLEQLNVAVNLTSMGAPRPSPAAGRQVRHCAQPFLLVWASCTTSCRVENNRRLLTTSRLVVCTRTQNPQSCKQQPACLQPLVVYLQVVVQLAQALLLALLNQPAGREIVRGRWCGWGCGKV